MTTHGVKYIGSKAALLAEIQSFVQEHLPSTAPKTLLDVFTGTTRVAQAFRAAGWHVTSSDLSWASEAYAHTFLLRGKEDTARIGPLLTELRSLAPAESGWITSNYCDVSGADGGLVRMWKPANGRKADAIRDQIAAWEASGAISHHEAMILVACLIFALDKVDSSVGVQQAYLKNWAGRAGNPLDLVDVGLSEGPVGRHIVGDALKVEYPAASVAYLDPPYSAHSYATYYHIWDSITRWDKPAVGLKTNRRLDRVSGAEGFDSGMVSPWNSKKTARNAFRSLVARLPVQFVVISYNDESLVSLADLEADLRADYGAAAVIRKTIPYRRNIMAQIGNAEAKEEKKTANNEVLLWVQKGSQTP
jgi:adenine-specific DNA-methyltransferase